jgi:hypothetical protein
MPSSEHQSYVCDPSVIKPVAKEVGLKNRAGVKNITINDSDIIIGQWDSKTLTFTETLAQPDAVRVFARRDGSANGPISTFFARIFNIDTFEISAWATAALTGQSTSDPGEVELPIGISTYWFENNICKDEIKFSPTNDPESCAGWNTFTQSPSNDPTVRSILDGLVTSPATTALATSFNYIGGDLSVPTFDSLLMLFKERGYDVTASGDPVMTDADGNPITGHQEGAPGTVPLVDDDGNRLEYPDDTPRNKHMWNTTVVVYDWPDCSNPNTSIPIAGYARVAITDVLGPPHKTVKGFVDCDYVSSEDTRGGGGEFGIKGSIPGLVEPFS